MSSGQPSERSTSTPFIGCRSAVGWRSQSKSWMRPVRPQRSSSPPELRAYARIAASTARQCLRSPGFWIHSSTNASAWARLGSVASVTVSPSKHARPRHSCAASDRSKTHFVRSGVLEMRPILVDERLPLLGHAVVREDRLHGTRGFARLAIDAFVGMDVVLVFALVDAVDGAHLDARLVLHTDARLGDHERHGNPPSRPALEGPANALRSRGV